MHGIKSKIHALQSEILEATALGQPFEVVANLLCRRVEALAPAATCSILRIKDGRIKPSPVQACRCIIRKRSMVWRSDHAPAPAGRPPIVASRSW